MASISHLLGRARSGLRRALVWPIATERRRFAVTGLVALALFAYVGRKLVLVQLRPDADKVYHLNQYKRSLPAMRGPIRDRIVNIIGEKLCRDIKFIAGGRSLPRKR